MDCQREAKPLEFTQGALAQLTGGTGPQAQNKRSLHGVGAGTGFSRFGYVMCVGSRCYKSVPIGDELWMDINEIINDT